MLIKVIEEKRNQMIVSAKKHGLLSKKTVKLSQELDKLLNLYEVSDISRLKKAFKSK